MNASLYSLDLAPEQLRLAEEAVRKLAFEIWEKAGSPPGDGVNFWREAESKWIGQFYVPTRTRPDCLSPQIDETPSDAMAKGM